MPSSVQNCTGEACGVRLYSVVVLSTIICCCFIQPAEVKVALIGPHLSTKVLVPQALHACITSPSAAPFIGHGYAAVRPSLFDAESDTIPALLCSVPKVAASRVAACSIRRWRMCSSPCMHASAPRLLHP